MTKRTLMVQTDHGTVRCNVVRIEATGDPTTWVVVVQADDWLAGGNYPSCTMRKGEDSTPGSYSVFDYIAGEGTIHTKGLFRPDVAG